MAQQEKIEKGTPAVERREITAELQESYLDYAMSVIVSRALPDVRDGLKPVHRRILWAMWDMGLTHTAKSKKSANVVGSVLGAYHPHGDTAVYDAMVRMAQNFSLRYPLIEGQGNWGCFTEDTKVKLADGRNLSFGELIQEDSKGKTNYAYTVNGLGLISVAKIENPRVTRKNAELIKITLDSGAEIKCTPDHLFMLKDRSYKEAQHLTKEDSLMPLYEKLSEKTDRLNREGYILIHQNKTSEWVPAHHLADNYNLTNDTYKKSDGRVRHHVDFNKLNNSPENIKRLHWGEHWKVHYTQAANQHKNPEYRLKLAAGRNRYWANEDNKKTQSKIKSEWNKQKWQDPIYREKIRKSLSNATKEYIKNHPEKRVEFAARGSQTLKRLWQDPKYKALFHEKIVKGNKNHITNKTGRLKFLNICKKAIEKFSILNYENYELARGEVYPYGAAPLWQTGLQRYFQNNPDLVRQEINKNHRIIKIEKIQETEDVYDLTISGSNNFALGAGIFVHNSVDGDSAAAMRYTECRLSKIAEELLGDIDKETVDWQPNYDNSREEPKVLPGKLPNLLLNGAMGIAVGMATSIPPHNLGEVVEAATLILQKPKSTVADIMEILQGPDFPTGGIIYDKRSMAECYASGKGSVTTRALAEVVEKKNNQYAIVITEIPYQVNKSELIIKIAELIEEKRILGIRDVRDESDKDGLRVVIELKNDVPPQKILNQLYNHTDLQKDFHLNLISLEGGLQPQLMSIKDMLEQFLAHRKEVVRRRALFDLKKARERAHILEGLSKALSAIDRVIATIKKSKDKEDAHQNLVGQFKLSDLQATAILEMRLQTLAALERQKIEEELKEKRGLIKELELLLQSPEKIKSVVRDELKDLKDKYGDARRTRVVAHGLKEFSDEDLVPEEEAVITLSSGGYIKRVNPEGFRVQRRGGKGMIGGDMGEEDFVTHFVSANTHDNMLFFTTGGKVYQTKCYDIPVGSRISKGKAIHNFLEIPPAERVSAIVAYSGNSKAQSANSKTLDDSRLALSDKPSVIMVTENGVIKKTPLHDFLNVRRSGIIALKLKPHDVLRWISVAHAGSDILIATQNGQAIRFKEKDVRPMGRAASGVTAIRLKKGDRVSSLDIVPGNAREGGTLQLLVMMALGFAKRTALKEYKVQRRGGSGIKTAKVNSKTGQIISARVITDEEELLALSTKGQIIKTAIKDIRIAGRATQGVRIMKLKAGDKIAGIVCL